MRGIVFTLTAIAVVQSVVKRMLLEWRVSSYKGQVVGEYSCMFYLILKDYTEFETRWFSDVLDNALEQFSRNLGESGAVVRPYKGDVETVAREVGAKQWTKEERDQIDKGPGLLMIDVDFDEFDPRACPWLYFYIPEEDITVSALKEILNDLVKAAVEPNKDIFKEAHSVIHDLDRPDFTEVFQLQPGIWGCSVDLVKGAQLIKKLHDRITSRPQTSTK